MTFNIIGNNTTNKINIKMQNVRFKIIYLFDYFYFIFNIL